MRLLAVGLVVLLASPLYAATFVVNGSGAGFDAVPGDGVCEQTPGAGDCTLAGAVQEANALFGPDTIDVPAGTYLVTGLRLTDDTTINGAGAAATIVDGQNAGTVIDVVDARATLSSLTVRRGNAGTAGGIAIEGGADVLLADCTVRDNHAGNVAGGVYVGPGARATIVDSTIANNSAFNVGGGVSVEGTATVIGSTISGNSAGNVAGGLENERDTTIVDSTISGNVAGNTKGGIGNEGTLTLNNVTVTNNRPNGLGNHDNGDPNVFKVYVSNTIVAGNQGYQCDGELTTLGHNLLGDQTGVIYSGPGPLCGLVDGGGAAGSDFTNVADPGLFPLGMIGGPTATHGLTAGSLAREHGSPLAPGSGGGACEATDQRGIARPQLATCDIGAVEMATCGDGVLDPGELCDDGNNLDGDGCDGNCTPTGCGNGIVTAGEQCDDGNTDDDDCCTATCQLPPMDEMVNGAAGKSRLSIRQSGVPSPVVTWRWASGTAITPDDFGSPLGWSAFHLCAIEDAWPYPQLVMWASAQAGSTGDGSWTASGNGYRYVGTSADGGVMKLVLKAGLKGKIAVKGKGSRFHLRRLPRNDAVTVFVRRSDGAAAWGDRLGTGRTAGLKFDAR